ncbi:protein kinase domain containing protein [Stylonychia lemnae]|uniref:Protein kinase domain containing protein n=1 Tax=Stylonychia lemnae TaxID=5949 RepID=A0A077ZVY9_STYLE|nr:protein kinase domain containing protein [Stylonychia lemnae]|eukprot:CDW73420.1 protein kinase domain containing protein [Stylonychia lemnae]
MQLSSTGHDGSTTVDGLIQNDSFYGSMGSSNDLATHTTLPSDSSPFREKYEIDEDGELLGEGTHCVVRECKCKVTLQNHAVKIFRSEDEEMFIHAEREFKILEKLKGNPNIVQGIEYIPEFLRSRGYLVLEKIEGQHILHLIENGPVSEEQAKTMIKQVISAVDYMHENGVVHRDLNPTNVFLVDQKTLQIKILDFNVSKLVENQRSRRNSLDEEESKSYQSSPSKNGKYKYSLFTKTGTPIYSAPEMHQAYRYTEAVDMWGIGTILYTLLMGEPPFYESSIPVLMKKVQSADYDRSSPQWQNLSLLGQEFIMGLLEVDPLIRFTTKEALAHPWFIQ